ncbi:class I SAM-dependent methyltransferase [Plastoroseomonas arctica]|uniref:Arsenite methyltransferase n=1 Tax=Plastoroseomonas arctica TaxID=1509237 RepID=A0AAF1KP95_9PROT|nr:class I SAM-dependent methyltransferase [Plastoroseomonas arctica]MBR0655588.1 class I SAM-dependent methyltransferase [Plastoroseomonas arctica]
MPETLRARLRDLALRALPPYRTLVSGFEQTRARLARIEEEQRTTTALVRSLSDRVGGPVNEGSSGRQFTIRIQRGDFYWDIAPEDFAAFGFADGDALEVQPAAAAVKLPHIWDALCLPCADGTSIRVPPVYKFYAYKGFRIPSHLIALTGGPAEQLEQTGAAHIANFQRHVGIEAGMCIVDVGCGIGRDAFQLFDILGPTGAYVGIDVTPDSIRWCSDNITRRDPRFTFHHFNAHNELYNPFGDQTSMDFVMPIADASVDRIVLSSVFTHILEDEILHYMKEFRRVLKPSGLVYASFFLHTAEALEAAQTKGNTAWLAKFDIPLGNGLFANDPTYPRGAVALTDDAARRLIAAAGLRLDRPYLKGWWSGLHETAEDGQDVMILGV